MIQFGREICSYPAVAEAREWLVTNGIGGFAMGTIAGTLTRRYHGLLIAALKPPVGRTLLLAKLDEDAKYDGQHFKLYTNHWAGGTVEEEGLRYLESFRLEGTTPVWSYAYADALLEKRVWMHPGANTTYVRYTLRRGSGPFELYAKTIVNHRDYHSTTIRDEWQTETQSIQNGLRVQVYPEATPFYLLAPAGEFWPEQLWYEDYYLPVEEYRGQNDVVEDHVHLGVFGATLQPGDSFTIVASTEPDPELNGRLAYQERQRYERQLIVRAAALPRPPLPELALAADQFIVRRAVPGDPDGRSVIAGYPWFSDWGRDTMISLPGLTLSTGRPEVAASILRTFASFVDQGMLPNRFPDAGEEPEYNTLDATLWYFEAIRAYHQATADEVLVHDLFPVLVDIVGWHRRGTRYNIRVHEDGLLYGGADGVQLTWMDAKVDDWVVTPRIGKPVEINALWYNALRCLVGFARLLGRETHEYEKLAARAQRGFARFWNAEKGYCYDGLDGPAGDDPALRPNQLFAVSLPHSPLTPEQQKAVVDVCARHLLTSHGLRSLAPHEPDYQGHYGGDRRQRDGAYHQGTAWGWLIGPFVSAHLRVYGDKAQARAFLRPLLQHLHDHGVGSISEIFDGDPPFRPRGCSAQAWSVAELLRTWQETAGKRD